MKVGTVLNLTCVLLRSPEAPSYIYWFHNDDVINYSDRDGMTVITDEKTRTSRLTIASVSYKDTGNYTCDPANAKPASVIVNVMVEGK